jgi:hypothetical protein
MAKDKCDFCKEDGVIYKHETSNANMMFMEPNRIMLAGSIPNTSGQVLFIAVPRCPICGREFRSEVKK